MKYALTVLMAMTIAVELLSVSCASADKNDPADNASIIDRLRIEFRKRNPRLEHVDITDIRSSASSPSKYFVVAHAMRKDRSPSDDLSDEMFGVFVVDAPLHEIVKTIDIFAVTRWNDTEIRITEVSSDAISISVFGSTRGDVQAQKKYPLNN